MRSARFAGWPAQALLLATIAFSTAVAARAGTLTFNATQHSACFVPTERISLTVTATNGPGAALEDPGIEVCSLNDLEWSVSPAAADRPALQPVSVEGCARAQGAGPWLGGTNEIASFVGLVKRPDPNVTWDDVLHLTYSAFASGISPQAKRLDIPDCRRPGNPYLVVDPPPSVHDLGNLPSGSVAQFILNIFNKGYQPTTGPIQVRDVVPNELEILDVTCMNRGCTISRQGQMVTVTSSEPLTPFGFGIYVLIRVRARAGAHGAVTNVAKVWGGGDPSTSAQAPRSSDPVSVTVGGSSALPPAATPTGPGSTPAGIPTFFGVNPAPGSDAAPAKDAGVTYSWQTSDAPLFPLATGSSFVHTFTHVGVNRVSLLATQNGATAIRDLSVNVSAPPPGCSPTANSLCLLGGRFKVEADWQALPNQANGAGNAHPITSDTGAFYFFDPANLELIVKVLDGRGVNGKFWIFFGALSNLQYQIKVTDTQTGQVREYFNQQGDVTSMADTSAFPLPAGSSFARTEAKSGGAGSTLVPAFQISAPADLTPPAKAACGVDELGITLCIGGHFDVITTFDAPNGSSGYGQAVQLTPDTGYFTFFDPSNIELVIKVIDGRTLNNRYWVFYAGLSDVRYTVSVKDRDTGNHVTYVNQQGQLQSVADTSALSP